MNQYLTHYSDMIPKIVAQKYGPETAEDAFGCITQWLVSMCNPLHGSIVFLDTIVNHEAMEEAKRQCCVDEMAFHREVLCAQDSAFH